MIKIDGIAKRNLQEQVGYNSEQIDKIFELLDGLNVQDNLIKLTSPSGTLTAEEMAVVERDVAFIIYNYNVYIKASTSATEYIFKQVALSASDQGTYNVLQSFRIVVTRASGAYAYSSNNVLALYNKAEMDSLLGAKADIIALTAGLATKANISGQAFTGPITAPSIIETMTGYTFTDMAQSTGSTKTIIYAGAVRNGKIIRFFVACKVQRTSDTFTAQIGLARFGIPSDVYDALYPTTISGNDFLDVRKGSFAKTHTNFVDIPLFIQKGSSNNFFMYANITNLLELNTDYFFRYEVTFLLSDNLAS